MLHVLDTMISSMKSTQIQDSNKIYLRTEDKIRSITYHRWKHCSTL
jgi:hypothetical protein